MSLHLIALANVAAQRWRNGGGVTRELFVWPASVPGHAGDEWQLRISVAEIERDGPFSAYPGVERWFAVVDGAGVALHFADGKRLLNVRSEPLCFDGEQAPGCSLRDGATRDLNLMLRRAAGRSTMRRAQPDVEWRCAAPLRALFCAEPLTLQIDAADALALPAGTLTVATHAANQRWRVQGAGDELRAWWMDFQPVAVP